MQVEGAQQTGQQGFYAVKVRAAAETTVAGSLRTKGFDVLAPTYVEKRKYSDRIRKADRALFPGYVFVRMDAQELLPLVSTQGVSYIVKTAGGIAPLPPEDEAAITSLCKGGIVCEPCEYNFEVGQRVVIENGPLAGQQGVLVEAGKSSRIVISVNSIFRSVSVDARHTKVAVLQ